MSASSNTRPRRGRPSGKNRVPLTAEQRRARNAQYERERRQGLGAASSDLAEAVGCSTDTPTYELLKMVEAILKKPRHGETVDELNKQNQALEDEIAKLEKQQSEIDQITDWLLQPPPDEPVSHDRAHEDKPAENEETKIEAQIEDIKNWLLEPF